MTEDLSKISQADLRNAQKKAADYANDSSIEMAWAIKAYENAEMHMNLLRSVDPAALVLCECDDVVRDSFRAAFPDLDVQKLTEPQLKSAKAKILWREFSEQFKEAVEDYNYGTLLRLDAHGEYDEANTIFVTKIQFLAIEITRNRDGLNGAFRHPLSQPLLTHKEHVSVHS